MKKKTHHLQRKLRSVMKNEDQKIALALWSSLSENKYLSYGINKPLRWINFDFSSLSDNMFRI